MTVPWHHPHVLEHELPHLARLIAFVLRPGDTIALRGDLGAGKTTFARVLIRVLLGDEMAEVPSPTFSLLQIYETARFPIAHLDLYRLAGPGEAAELGHQETAARGVTIIEWPERAEEILPAGRLEVHLSEASANGADSRDVTLQGFGAWAPRLERLIAIERFLRASGWSASRLIYIQGDASARRYGRLTRGAETAILMDSPRQPDGPAIRNGLPYSRIAHLAEDVRPYIAVDGGLRAAGLSAPAIIAQNTDDGLLIVEDFDDAHFGRMVAEGGDQAELWEAAVDTLLHLRRSSRPLVLPLGDGSSYRLPRYDRDAMQIEVELLVDWYWPHRFGTPIPAAAREEFLRLWNSVFDEILSLPTGWVLRDFHSPNLMWLPDRNDIRRVGVLDFQDALEGHPAYDLVSLLQDARLDVPARLEQELLDRYCRKASTGLPDFDEQSFRFAYAALGAQRNTKIIGIFTRLLLRDGKPQYLQHIPRLWSYLERDLTHVILTPLRAWYESHLADSLHTPSSRS